MDPTPAQHARIIVAADPASGAFSATVDGVVVPNPSGGWQDAFSTAFAVVAERARQRGEAVDAVVSTSDWTGRFQVQPDGTVSEQVAPPLPEPRPRRRRPPLLAVLVPLAVLAVAAGVVVTSITGVSPTGESTPTAAAPTTSAPPAVTVPEFGTPTRPVAPVAPASPTPVPDLPTVLPSPTSAPAPPSPAAPSPEPIPRPAPAPPVQPVVAPRAPARPTQSAAPSPAPAPPAPPRTVLVADGAGNCLSGSASSVRSAPCDRTAAEQVWTVTPAGRLSHGSSCLAAVPVQSLAVEPCGSGAAQTWKVTPTGVVNGRSPQCLAVRGHDGRRVSAALGPCDASAARTQAV